MFGNVVEGKMILNDAGKIAQKCWLEITDHYPNAILDEFVIIPNHIHGIIMINAAVIFDEYFLTKKWERCKRQRGIFKR
ncbi:MAG: hypothetical protein KatS3mg028_0260 [Bacteroidia bacterium]|nr:MAG: hypothetical protein KatS3mg028_0260 [Bacteroidia bacterium]